MLLPSGRTAGFLVDTRLSAYLMTCAQGHHRVMKVGSQHLELEATKLNHAREDYHDAATQIASSSRWLLALQHRRP